MPTFEIVPSLALALFGLTTAMMAQGVAPTPRHFIVASEWVPIQIDHPQTGSPGAEDQGPNVLRFRNGQHLVVDLFEVEFLGQLRRPNRAPILILSARGCFACDIERQVYPVPADAATYVYGKRSAYFYPGSVSGGADPTEPTIFYKGRMFLGKCLAGHEAVVVWFQQERDSTGTWRPSVYRLSVAGDSVQGGFLKPMPAMSQTLRAVHAGACVEVPGIDQQQF